MTNTFIKINNKDYIIAFDINTLCLMDANGFDVMNMSDNNFSISSFRELFYYSLIKYHKKGMSQEKAGELMSEYIEEGGDISELTSKITLALAKSMGQSKTEGK